MQPRHIRLTEWALALCCGLQAVGTLVQWLQTEAEMQLGAQLIPRLLTVAQQCLETGDDDTPAQVVLHASPRISALTRSFLLVLRVCAGSNPICAHATMVFASHASIA